MHDNLFIKLCSEDKLQTGSVLSQKIKKIICDNTYLFKLLIKFKYGYMYNANDQDGYTAFKWLEKNGINDHYLFNFDPDNKVNYKDSFTWYKNSKRDVNIHLNKNNVIYRKFDWN